MDNREFLKSINGRTAKSHDGRVTAWIMGVNLDNETVQLARGENLTVGEFADKYYVVEPEGGPALTYGVA